MLTHTCIVMLLRYDFITQVTYHNIKRNPGHLANGHLANGHLANGHLGIICRGEI